MFKNQLKMVLRSFLRAFRLETIEINLNLPKKLLEKYAFVPLKRSPPFINVHRRPSPLKTDKNGFKVGLNGESSVTMGQGD